MVRNGSDRNEVAAESQAPLDPCGMNVSDNRNTDIAGRSPRHGESA
jgi:hypothetical protein